MKSTKELLSFIQYCMKNPGERFWQALRNWSGYHFVMVADLKHSKGMVEEPHTQPIDTFNFEKRRHDGD